MSWPMLLDTPKEECQKALRNVELVAYGALVSALRGQGELNIARRQLLKDAANVLHINTDRHKAEIRRAANDEKLATIAERISGPNTELDWIIEGKRTIPLVQRVGRPQTAFTAIAENFSELTAENANMPSQNPAQTTGTVNTEEIANASSPESSRSHSKFATPSSKEVQVLVLNVESSTEIQPSLSRNSLTPKPPVETTCRNSPTVPKQMFDAPITPQKPFFSGTRSSGVQTKITETQPGGLVIVLNSNTRFCVGDILTLTQGGETILGKVLRTGALPPVHGTNIAGINQAHGKRRNTATCVYNVLQTMPLPTVSSSSVKPNEAAADIPNNRADNVEEHSYEGRNSPSSSTDTAPSPDLNEEVDFSFGEASDIAPNEHDSKAAAGSSEQGGSGTNPKAESESAKSEAESDEEDFHLYYSSGSE